MVLNHKTISYSINVAINQMQGAPHNPIQRVSAITFAG